MPFQESIIGASLITSLCGPTPQFFNINNVFYRIFVLFTITNPQRIVIMRSINDGLSWEFMDFINGPLVPSYNNCFSCDADEDNIYIAFSDFNYNFDFIPPGGFFIEHVNGVSIVRFSVIENKFKEIIPPSFSYSVPVPQVTNYGSLFGDERQIFHLIKRSDNSFVIFYGEKEYIPRTSFPDLQSFISVEYTIYNNGIWSDRINIESGAINFNFNQIHGRMPLTIHKSTNDLAHFWYRQDIKGPIKHVALSNSNTLGIKQTIISSTETIGYILSSPCHGNNKLYFTIHDYSAPYVIGGNNIVNINIYETEDLLNFSSWPSILVYSKSTPNGGRPVFGSMIYDNAPVLIMLPDVTNVNERSRFYRSINLNQLVLYWEHLPKNVCGNPFFPLPIGVSPVISDRFSFSDINAIYFLYQVGVPPEQIFHYVDEAQDKLSFAF